MREVYFAVVFAVTSLAFAVTSPSGALAVERGALDDQMMRMIQLEALDDWCTDAYIDTGKLRAAVQAERTRVRAMTDSEQELRLSYARTKQIFLLGARETASSYCDDMYWLRNREGFTILRAIFRE